MSRLVRLFSAIAVSAVTLGALTGCGLGKIDTSSIEEPKILPAFHGTMMGGQTPIQNSTIKIYTTGSATNCSAGSTGSCTATDTGYGVATFLQEANTTGGGTAGQDTDAGGNFTFAGGYRCPAGEFAYIVGNGGNPGGVSNPANSKIMLVSALGRCEDLYATFTGAGYTSAPSVSFTNASGDTTGSGATGTAVLGTGATAGGVVSVTVTSGGSLYTLPPTVVFTGGGGSGATATAVLGSGGTADQVVSVTVPTNYDGSFVVLNEITTVAAGYALGNFASVSGSTVSIGAPSTNNAAQVSGVSTGTAVAAAGLYHAFLNATNLANPFSGSTLAGAPTTLSNNASAVLPNAMMNTVGNILAACVDSNGSTSACTSASLPSTADTFSIVKALAANPTFSGSTTAASNFRSLAPGVGAPFAPTIASVKDFSLAINYTNSAITGPNTGALDANDVFYVGNAGVNNAAPADVVSFSSNGTLLGASATNASFTLPYQISLDALGHGYFGNGSASGNNAVGVFSTSSGVPSSITGFSVITSTQGTQGTAGLLKTYGTAVDAANNVWVAGATNSGTAPASTTFAYECPPAITTATVCTGQAGGNNAPSSTDDFVAVDPNQNIWFGLGSTVNVLQNTGTAGAPTYASTIPAGESVVTTSNGGGSPITGVAFTGTPYAAYVSEYKTTGVAGVQVFTPAFSGAGVTGITPTAITASASNTGAYNPVADGNGVLWLAGFNDHAIAEYTPNVASPSSATTYKLVPCAAAVSACNSTAASVFTISAVNSKPTSVALDSTGSLWVTAESTTTPFGGQVVQIIGSAAPAWPLLSLGKTGKP